MPKLNAYHFNGEIDSYEIDDEESYGITSLGYQIKIKNEKRRILIHPERYKLIEIVEE